jgi:putative transposase
VIDVLADLFITRGTPMHIRSDNGPEFAAIAVKGWINGSVMSRAADRLDWQFT